MRFALRSAACALIVTFVLWRPASADLTPADTSNLTAALQTLSLGWDDAAHGTASPIFAKTQYTSGDWQTFFDGYFNTTGHAYTDLLRDYLGYPLFFWFSPSVNLNIQLGIYTPVWTKGLAIVAAHPSDLAATLFQDPTTRQTLFNVHKLHANLEQLGLLDGAVRSIISERYRQHIVQYPGYFGSAVTHDPATAPLLAWLRAQVWLSFVDAVPASPAHDAEVATALGLAGTKLTIWNTFGVLVMDNNGLDAAQVGALYDLLNGLPVPLTTPRFISVADFFRAGGFYQPIVAKGQQGGGYNYLMEIAGDRLHLSFDGIPNVSWDGLSADTPITYDAWNHVAATYDGATMRVYVNGVLRGSRSAAGAPAIWSTQPLQIGRADDFQLYFRGLLDDVKIWNRPLTATEIAAEAAGQAISTSGNVARYLMNETGGSAVADSSGTGNNATAFGAPIVPGHAGNGRSFDGATQYVQAPDSATLRLPGSFTLEAWLYAANENVGLAGGGSPGVNTFSNTITSASENSFPSDAAARSASTFCVATAHELNHIVRDRDILSNPALTAREQALLAQAGTTQLEYLRSNVLQGVGNDFFQNAPQEFFASISNQYFTDTANTLALGLSRFAGGHPGPLNQFLFFADVYAAGGTTTRAYTIDTNCAVGVSNVPLTRDSQGRLITLTLAGTTHNFGLDASGNVSSYYAGPPRPDLAFSEFTPSINANEKVSIANTFVNQGTAGTAGAFTTTFYLSADQAIDAGDVAIGSRSRTAVLAPAASSGATNAFSVPASVTPGNYYVLGMVDSGGTQIESFEINNIAVPAGTLNIRPDLAGHTISVARSGTTLNVTDSVANDGPLATAGSFRIDYYLSTDITLDAGDVLLGNRTITAALAANANSPATTTPFAVPQSLAPGTYRVLSSIDAGHAIAEADETNNVDNSATVSLKPDLVAGSLTASANGRTVTFVDSVRNDGALPASTPFAVEYRLSLDQSITTADPLLGQRTITSLAAGATSAATTPLTAPASVPAGSYYGAMWVDRLKAVIDGTATNNKLATSATVTVGP